MKKRIKIHGFLIFFALAGLVIFSRHLLRRPAWGTWAGYLDISGIFLFYWGYLFRISARGVKSESNPDGQTLITKGPYTATRNPMYLGTLLIGIGITLLLFRWWVFLLFLAVYLAVYIPEINREERALLQRFGEGFKNYCKRTPKFFPNIFSSGLNLKDTGIKPAWLKKELSSLAPALIFIFVIKAWEDIKFLGHIDYRARLLEICLLGALFILALSLGRSNISRK